MTVRASRFVIAFAASILAFPLIAMTQANGQANGLANDPEQGTPLFENVPVPPGPNGEARITVEQEMVSPDYGGIGLKLTNQTYASLLAEGLWAGLPRNRAIILANKTSGMTGYPVFDDLFGGSLAIGGVTPPERRVDGDNGQNDAWLAARTGTLLALGHYRNVISIGDALGNAGRAANPEVEWHIMAAKLWAGDLKAACEEPDRLSAQSRKGARADWQLLDAACKALGDDEQGAEFAADLAREFGVDNDTAFTLLDYMSGLKGGEVSSSLRAAAVNDPLSFAMARALDVKWSRSDFTAMHPATLAELVAVADMPLGDRIFAAELVRESGFGTRKLVRSLYQQAALRVAQQGARDGLSGANRAILARAVAYQSWKDAADPIAAAQALADLLTLAEADGKFAMMADLVLHDFSFPQAGPDFAVHSALFARAAIAAGMHGRAAAWLQFPTDGMTEDEMISDPGYRKLWPLLILSSLPLSDAVENGAVAWLATLPPEKRADAVTVFAAAEAMGRYVPDVAWQSLQEAGIKDRQMVSMPALPYWRGVAVAAAQKKRGEVLLLSSMLLQHDSGQGVNPAILSSVLSSLMSIGANETAHQVAVQAALEAGF